MNPATTGFAATAFDLVNVYLVTEILQSRQEIQACLDININYDVTSIIHKPWLGPGKACGADRESRPLSISLFDMVSSQITMILSAIAHIFNTIDDRGQSSFR
jgi:hypothetical protein